MLGITTSIGVAWIADPHLMVLGVLASGWVLDKLLAALEWLRGTPSGERRRPARAE